MTRSEKLEIFNKYAIYFSVILSLIICIFNIIFLKLNLNAISKSEDFKPKLKINPKLILVLNILSILGLIILFLVALRPEVMLFVLFFGYAATGAVFGIMRLGKKHTQIPASVYAPAQQINEKDLQEEHED